MTQREIQHLIVDIDSVQAHEKNVRQGDIGAISESLKAHGQYRPIVVDRRTNKILAGNHTWKAAKALGWKQISVGFVETKDDNEALRILLADNKANDLATYDETELIGLLKEIADTSEGLLGTLFDGNDLDDLVFASEYTHGNTQQGTEASADTEEYFNKGIRSLILIFEENVHTELTEKLKIICEKLSIDNHSEAIKHLIESWK
jgi:hypothetical protein